MLMSRKGNALNIRTNYALTKK